MHVGRQHQLHDQEKTISNDNDRHIVAKPTGAGTSRHLTPNAPVRTLRHKEAIDRAKEVVHTQAAAKYASTGRQGKIRNSDTVAPGNYPFPPRQEMRRR